MPALYRTYRPQNFKQIIGQDIIKSTLQNAIIHNRTVHSYLFSGPRGTGKTTMSRIFAKALNCLNRPQDSAEPCNICANCLAIQDNSFIDLIEIDAASNRGIDEIRSLKEAVRFAPSQKNGYKIYIIDESHMLTKDASNALLKTLEEPPKNTIFILATTDAHKMIPTILSRVQKFDFKPLSSAELKEKILFIMESEKITIDDSVINQIILQAMGGARDAESILGKLMAGQSTHITQEFAATILGKNSYFEAYQLLTTLSLNQLSEAIHHIHTLYDQGYAIEQLLLHLIHISHMIFLMQISSTLINTDTLLESEYETLTTLSSSIPQHTIITFIQSLEEIKNQTYTAYLPYLPLEITIARIWGSPITPSDHHRVLDPTPEPQPIIEKEPITPPLEQQPVPPKPNTETIVPKPKKIDIDTPIVSEKSPGDIYTVKKLYPTINKSLSKTNKSLSVIFAKTEPIEITDQTLTIAVESNFYRDRLEKQTSIILDSIREFIDSIIGITFISQKIVPQPIELTPLQDISDNDQPKNINDTIADIFKDSM